MKTTIIFVMVVALLAYGFFYYSNQPIEEAQEIVVVRDHQNAQYTVDGQPVQLVGGVSEVETAPGSASFTTVKYFGNEVRKDLDEDGREDVVFLITKQTAGSGLFYYAVASLDKEEGYIGSHAILLGDRIAPTSTESGPGKSVIVNYADRAVGEPMTTAPSVAKSIRLILDIPSMQFGEVVQNFEGEADPKRMSLDMKTWVWVRAEYPNGKSEEPIKKDAFTLKFDSSNKLSITTDCNNGSGSYTASGKTLSFGNIATTLMYCGESSQESKFHSILANTQEYLFTPKGEMVLVLKNDQGSVYFR